MKSEVVKFSKPIRPKGKIKIELFCCDSGRKLHEIKNTNFIAKGVDYIYEARMRDLFTNERFTGGQNAEQEFHNPYTMMVLTDSKHDEDPNNEWLIKGKQVGFANTDSVYSGDSEVQGTYNASESITTAEHVHMVFDFPTHSANGTFESIYFKPKLLTFDRPSIRDGMYQLPVNYHQFIEYGDYIYGKSSGNVYKLSKDFEVLEQVSGLGSTYNGMEIISGYLYYTHGRFLRKIHLDNLFESGNDYEDVKVFDSNVFGLAFDSNERRLYIYQGNSLEIRDYDNELELLESIELGLGANDYARLRLHEEFLFAGRYYFDKDFNQHDYGNEVRGFIDNQIVVENRLGQSTLLCIYPRTHIGSRCKLDAPVTKTENTTMKVTYDFALPKMWSI